MTANTNNDQAKEAELIQTYIAQGVSGHCHCSPEPGCLHRQPEGSCLQGYQGRHHQHEPHGDPSFLAGGYTSDDATNGKIVGTNAAEFIKANIKGDVNVAQVDFDDQTPRAVQGALGWFLCRFG